MANAHAEIGVIQQAYDAGLTQGENMTIVVRGETPCSYCIGSISNAFEKSGLNSLELISTTSNTKYKTGELPDGSMPENSTATWTKNQDGSVSYTGIQPKTPSQLSIQEGNKKNDK